MGEANLLRGGYVVKIHFVRVERRKFTHRALCIENRRKQGVFCINFQANYHENLNKIERHFYLGNRPIEVVECINATKGGARVLEHPLQSKKLYTKYSQKSLFCSSSTLQNFSFMHPRTILHI